MAMPKTTISAMSGFHQVQHPNKGLEPANIGGRFEFDENGSFKVCKDDRVSIAPPRSTTSSIEAEVHSTPDTGTVPLESTWDENDLDDEDSILDFDFFLLGTGCWQADSKDHSPHAVVPWRMEPVTHDDIQGEIECLLLESQSSLSFNADQDHNKPRGSLHLQKWRHDQSTLTSVAESTDSVPNMTDCSSWDTDSICLSDRLVRQDDKQTNLETHRPEFFAYHFHSFSDENIPASAIDSNLENRALFNNAGLGGQFEFDFVSSVPKYIPSALFPKQSERQCNILTTKVDSSPMSLEACEREDSDSSSESDSVWMSDYSESVPVLEEGHPFSHVKSEIVTKALLFFEARVQPSKEFKYMTHMIQTASQATDGGDSSSSHTLVPGSAEGSSSKSSSGGKRAWSGFSQKGGDGTSNGDGGNEDDQGPPKKRGRATRQSDNRKASLACPYAKKDAVKYRSCYSYILKRSQDVKQHLSRCHQLPIYCPRCKEIFNSETERDAHLTDTATSICEIRMDITYEGVTREQKEQLSGRVQKGMTLEDQWFTIFDILFPNHRPKPSSAYVNTSLTVDLEAFQDMMVQIGPSIIVSTLESHGIRLSSISNLEHNLSQVYDVALMESMQAIANRWTAALDQHPSVLDADQVDGSELSRHATASEPSRTSSDTLVERRRNTHPPISLDSLTEEAENSNRLGASPAAGETDQGRPENMLLLLRNTEPPPQPMDMQTEPPGQHPTSFQSVEEGGGTFEDQDLLWDDYLVDETDDIVMSKICNGPPAVERDWT